MRLLYDRVFAGKKIEYIIGKLLDKYRETKSEIISDKCRKKIS